MPTFSEFSGSPYHIGLNLGKAGAAAMHDVIRPSAIWEELMQWLGSDQLHALQERVQQHHPYIWDELQGLSRGLELHPDEVFLWNSQGALPAHRSDDAPPATSHEAHDDATRPIGYRAVESTTILMPTSEGPRIIHHMAGDPGIAKHCGVAEFIVDQGPAFAAFISPGMLPGHAVAVTSNGLCMTVNTVRPHDPGIGIPPAILTRALLNMPDLSSAIQFLNDSTRCGGLHLSLAQRGGSALLSIETTADQVSIQHAKAPTLHTNHLIHDTLIDVAQTVLPSSRLRLDRCNDALEQPHDVDPLRVLAKLGNDANSGLPLRTLVTADLHVNSEAVEWDVYEDVDEPARFRMRDARHI